MGLVPLVTPAHFTKRRSSQVVVASTPTSPRSPPHRTRSLLAAATPEDAAVSPVSGAGSVFSAAQEDTGVIADLQGSPEFDPESHPVEQEPLIDWDRWWVDNVVLPVPNGNPIEGGMRVEQVLQEPRYAEVAEDIGPAATGAANNTEIENALENEVQPVIEEVEGRPIRRNRWGEVTVAIATVASLWFTGVLKGLGRGAA